MAGGIANQHTPVLLCAETTPIIAQASLTRTQAASVIRAGSIITTYTIPNASFTYETLELSCLLVPYSIDGTVSYTFVYIYIYIVRVIGIIY